MQYLVHAMTYSLGGAPVWGWLLVALAAAQEGLARSSRFKSNSWIQLLGNVSDRVRKTYLGRFPVLGQALWLLALPRTPEAAAPAGWPLEEPKLRQPPKDAGAIALVVLLAVALAGLGLALSMAGLAGCAPTKAEVAALRVDAAASQSLVASYAQWRDLDRARQLQIVADAPDAATARQRLTEWRAAQAEVDKAFADARDAVAALHQGAMLPGDARAKAYPALLGRVVSAFTAIASVFARRGIHLPAPVAAPPQASVGPAWAADAPAPCDDEERGRWCPLVTLPEVA